MLFRSTDVPDSECVFAVVLTRGDVRHIAQDWNLSDDELETVMQRLDDAFVYGACDRVVSDIVNELMEEKRAYCGIRTIRRDYRRDRAGFRVHISGSDDFVVLAESAIADGCYLRRSGTDSGNSGRCMGHSRCRQEEKIALQTIALRSQ